jgi:Protein of unknown function (DUF1571)/LysM domain
MRQFLLINCLLLCNISVAQKKITARELFDSMVASMEKVRTCTYVLNIEERVFGKISQSQYLAKVNVAPLKIYTYSVHPNPGAEALYSAGANNGKVLINPNKFPYINMSLSVNSMLLRKPHQYNILQMGFGYFHDILKKNVAKNSAKLYASLSIKEDFVYHKKEYHVLEIHSSDFGYTNYKVQKGENVTEIANKLLVNDHMILEINEDIDDYDDVKPGQMIKVPTSFAKKITVYLDKTTHLPLVQIVYDDKGFYSKIEFSSFILNPVIQNEEFTRNYYKYKF